MRGGAAPPFRKNLIGPGRARPYFFAKLARGPLTLRAIAFHQNGRSRAKFFVRGDDVMHTLDYIRHRPFNRMHAFGRGHGVA